MTWNNLLLTAVENHIHESEERRPAAEGRDWAAPGLKTNLVLWASVKFHFRFFSVFLRRAISWARVEHSCSQVKAGERPVKPHTVSLPGPRGISGPARSTCSCWWVSEAHPPPSLLPSHLLSPTGKIFPWVYSSKLDRVSQWLLKFPSGLLPPPTPVSHGCQVLPPRAFASPATVRFFTERSSFLLTSLLGASHCVAHQTTGV